MNELKLTPEEMAEGKLLAQYRRDKGQAALMNTPAMEAAQWSWRRIFIWFWVVPIIAGILLLVISKL
jgi:hypothetical protein